MQAEDKDKLKKENELRFKHVIENDMFRDSRSPFETYVNEEVLREEFFSDEKHIAPIYSFRKNIDTEEYEYILEKIRMDAFGLMCRDVNKREIIGYLSDYKLRKYHKLNPVSEDFIFETEMVIVEQMREGKIGSFVGLGFIYLIDVESGRKCHYGNIFLDKDAKSKGKLWMEADAKLLAATYDVVKHPVGIPLMLDSFLNIQNDLAPLINPKGTRRILRAMPTPEASHKSLIKCMKLFSNNLIDIVRISNYQTKLY